MLVPLLKDEGNLPEIFLNTLPEYCSCGFPYEITTTLTELKCSNPKCPTKIKHRTLAMLQDLGITSIGMDVISAFVDKFNAQDPYLIFGYDFEKDGVIGKGITETRSKEIQTKLSRRNRLTVGDYLLYANMPNIDSSIRIICTLYPSIEELYAKLSIAQLTEDLGYSLDKGIINDRVIKVYKTLMMYKDDLLQNHNFVDIVDLEKTKIIHTACDETEIRGFNSLQDFITTINNSQSQYYIENSFIVYPNTEYYLTNHTDALNKERAEKINTKTFTPLEFFATIQKGTLE